MRKTLKNIVKKIHPSDRIGAEEDWNLLKRKASNCPNSITSFDRTGLRTLDEFFFKHRIRAAGKSGWTFPEAMANNKTRKYLEQKVQKLRKKTLKNGNEGYEKQMYHLFQLYFGAVNQFRPAEALRLLCKLTPKEGILDFSSGWGGRCLAAMAYGIPYFGCDANKELEAPYKSLVKFCGLEGTNSVRMTFQPSETVEIKEITGGRTYDLIFTSPPYFTLEKYRGMPSYEGRDGFLRDFLGVVMSRAWKGLSSGGHMAINMPTFMYDWVRIHGKELGLPSGKATKKIKLPVKSRHGKNAARGYTIGTTEQKRYEWIYIWKKQ